MLSPPPLDSNSSDDPVYSPPSRSFHRPNTTILNHPTFASSSSSSSDQRSDSDSEAQDNFDVNDSEDHQGSTRSHTLLQPRRQSLGLGLSTISTSPTVTPLFHLPPATTNPPSRRRGSTITFNGTGNAATKEDVPLHPGFTLDPPFSRPSSAVTVPSRPPSSLPSHSQAHVPRPSTSHSPPLPLPSTSTSAPLRKRGLPPTHPPIIGSSSSSASSTPEHELPSFSPPLLAWGSPELNSNGFPGFSANRGGRKGDSAIVRLENGNANGNGQVEADPKGKGKETTPQPSAPTAYNPLDPLSSLRHQHSLSLPSNLSTPPRTTTKKSSTNSISFPSPGSSSTSFSTAPSSTPLPPTSQPQHQQSLHEILQTVDLEAALKLFQTVQHQAIPLAAPPLSTPSATAALRASNVAPTVVAATASNPSRQPLPPPLPSSTPHAHFAPTPPPPLLSPPSSPSLGSDLHTGLQDRRRSISLNFGALGNLGMGRTRTNSISGGRGIGDRSLSISSLIGGGGRVPDERATMGGAGRGFEDQISKVHLSLSPSTLRRTQNCIKYLSLRYTPLFAVLSFQPVATDKIPNLLKVSRWREENEEEERLKRRALVGTGTTKNVGGDSISERSGSTSLKGFSSNGRISGLSTGGSVPVGKVITTYGPRRNRYPKAWEVYPDEMVAFLAEEAKLKTKALQNGNGHGIGLRKSNSERMSLESSGGAEIGGDRDYWEQNHQKQKPSSFSSPRRKSYSTTSLISNDNSPVPSSGSRFSSSIKPPITPIPSFRNSLEQPPPLSVSTSNAPLPSPPTNSQLRRSGSLGTNTINGGGLTTGASLKSPFSSWSKLSGTTDLEGASGSASLRKVFKPSPYSGSVSREHLSEPSSPKSPFTSTTGKTPKSGFSRRFDKIRGKNSVDLDHSNGDGKRSNFASGESLVDLIGSPGFGFDGDEDHGGAALVGTVGSSGRKTHSRVQSSDPGSSKINLGGSKLRRSGGGGKETTGEGGGGGYKSTSGGEDTRRRPPRGSRIWAAAWQGFKGSLDTSLEPDLEAVRTLELKMEEDLRLRRKRRLIMEEESDDDEGLQTREVLDLNQEDFDIMNTLLRKLRVQLSHAETLLPRLPPALNNYLDSLSDNRKKISDSYHLELPHSLPRLPASVIAELAQAKLRHQQTQITTSSDSESLGDSSPESSDSSEIDSDGDDNAPERALDLASTSNNGSHRPPNSYRYKTVVATSRSRSRPRQQSLSPGVGVGVGVGSGHSRRTTESISRPATMGRMRAQTLAAPPRLHDRDILSQNFTRRDPLNALAHAIEELERGTKEVDEETNKLTREQDLLNAEINSVVLAVDDVQKRIDNEHFQQLRGVEDHLFRLRASISKPRPEVDALWAALSYLLTGLFWVSWLVVTILRMFRSFIAGVVFCCRWLIFLH